MILEEGHRKEKIVPWKWIAIGYISGDIVYQLFFR